MIIENDEVFSIWKNEYIIKIIVDSDEETTYQDTEFYSKLKIYYPSIEIRLFVALEQYYFTNYNYSWSKEIFNHISEYINLHCLKIVERNKKEIIYFYFKSKFDYDHYIEIKMIKGNVEGVKKISIKELEG